MKNAEEVISFRIMHEKDLPLLNEIRNIYAEEYLHDSRTFTLDETKYWFENQTSSYYHMILLSEIPIGYFRLSNYSQTNKNIYIGADIHPQYTGKGLGYLSYKKFIPFIFEQLKLNKIALEVLSSNIRAYNLYIKLGFKEEGRKREEVLKGDKYYDSIIMSILKSEWN